jgi:hypothetical protein
LTKVREYKNDKTLDDKTAMTAAVKWCIAHDILKQFLEANASEVVNMLLGEWNIEDCVRVRAREAREEGREEGLKKGIINLSEFGMLPEQIAKALKLPQTKVLQYLGDSR